MFKKSFFDKLTSSLKFSGEEENFESNESNSGKNALQKKESSWTDEDAEGELTVDVYQTPTEIVVQTMVAGVKPEDLEINISRDMITIKGNRQESKTVSEEDFFTQELYWGSFSRTILLPQEVEPEEAEATEKHGLLTIKLPKIDKGKRTTLKIKSL